MNVCKKRKFDKIAAMLVVANAQRSRLSKRQERRTYWCDDCKAYHTTSQEEK